jgi:hypothetical protein
MEKSSYIDRPLSDRAIDTMLRWVERWPGSSNTDGGGAALFAWGGAMNRPAPDATAFVHRGARFLMVYATSWTAEDPPGVVSRGLDWIEGFFDAMRAHVAARSYQNFIDRSLRNWQQAYYGPNFDRLVKIKTRHDPDDLFHFAQSIPTTTHRASG